MLLYSVHLDFRVSGNLEKRLMRKPSRKIFSFYEPPGSQDALQLFLNRADSAPASHDQWRTCRAFASQPWNPFAEQVWSYGKQNIDKPRSSP